MSQVQEADIAVSGNTERILSIDLIRGFFLLVILIDHIELYPNGLDFFTGKGRLWVGAAEGFFFLSGLLIGMIYKRRLHLGMKFIVKKMWLRALELYVVGTLLTFVFVYWVVWTHHAPIKDSLPIPFPLGHYAWLALTFRFTYGWADFLVHFAALMFVAPLVFFLVARGRWKLALAGIIAVWLLRHQSFTMAWQLLFNVGIIIGYYWYEIKSRFNRLPAKRRILTRRLVIFGTVVTFVASYTSVFVLNLLFYLWGAGHLTPWQQHVVNDWGNWNHDIWNVADKWTLGPLRIGLFFLWFTTLFWLFRHFENRISRATHGVLELLGRNSLYVYVAEAFIVFILKMYLIPYRTAFWQNFLITTLAIVMLIIATAVYQKLQKNPLPQDFPDTQRLISKGRALLASHN